MTFTNIFAQKEVEASSNMVIRLMLTPKITGVVSADSHDDDVQIPGNWEIIRQHKEH